MPRLRVRKSAEADIDAAFTWYETQREGLGLEFLTAIEATIATIQRSPDLFPQVYQDVRRALVRKFPYAVFYLGHRDSPWVTVIACVHVRRHPRRWQSRRC